MVLFIILKSFGRYVGVRTNGMTTAEADKTLLIINK